MNQPTRTDRPCVRRCVRAGTEADPLLLPARHGNYCARCWQRLDDALIQAPELVQHVLGHVLDIGTGEERVDGGPGHETLPFNEAAFTDANEVYRWLVYWSAVWAKQLGQPVPSAAARAWRRADGQVMGLPANVAPEDAAREVGWMCVWLRLRLDRILLLDPDDIDEFDSAMCDVWRLNARWPRMERPRYAPMPCPREDCGKRLGVYPPGFPGDERRIICDAGHYYPEAEYRHLLLVFEQIQRERIAQRSAERVTRHLIRKYADA